MNRYRFLFFDLDRTLWDWDTNSVKALTELYNTFSLDKWIPSAVEFNQIYNTINDRMWHDYQNGLIKKEELRSARFEATLAHFGLSSPELALKIGTAYLKVAPRQNTLMPRTIELLEYLKTKDYRMAIVTNGFAEVQTVKMDYSGLNAYFDRVITSESCGYLKPRPEIFHHALSSMHAKKSETLMIGDDWETDIMGARKAGIDQVFINRHKAGVPIAPTFTIERIDELLHIL